MRKTIAQRLKSSQLTNATLTTMQEVDMSALMLWRKHNQARILDEHGVRLGFMGAFVKAATLAAQRVPVVNAALDIDKEEIIYRDYVDISIAVSTPKGLVTPVLKDCERLDIVQIEKRVRQLAEKVSPAFLLQAL
jgi:2-oxoglutarate dehydrogenase E2 component (dihydrolipoamide succinyltransferase)